MLELKTFGCLRLAGDDGSTVELSRRRLAFLALLASAGERGVSRERLVAYLWPDASAESGRHSLEQLISTLRSRLGTNAFEGVDPLRLNSVVIASDVGDFARRLRDGDLAGAVAVYGGPFLDGFYLGERKDFEEWSERERARHADSYREVLEGLAGNAQLQGDGAGAVRWWRQVVVADPLRADGAIGLMRALVSIGDSAGAVQHARIYERLLREELQLPLDRSVADLCDALQRGIPSASSSPPDRPALAPKPLTNEPGLEPEPVVHVPEGKAPAAPTRLRYRAFAALLVLVTGGLGAYAWSERSGSNLTRWSVALPDSAPIAFVGTASLGHGVPALAISPDARHVVYVGQSDAGTALFLHELGSFDTRRIPGTEGAFNPFFSPDGVWVAYFAEGRLKKVAVGGGSPMALGDVVEPHGGTWTDRNLIVVADNEGRRLRRIPANGGALTDVAVARFGVMSPVALPGATWVLHTVGSQTGVLAVTSIEAGETKLLRRGGLPSASRDHLGIMHGIRPLYSNGYLVYVAPTEGRLLAVRFDAQTLEVKGDPVPILEGVRVETAGAQTSVAGNTLVYATGGDARTGQLVWGSATGSLNALPIPPGSFGQFRISPTGNRLLLPVGTTDGPAELQIFDLRDLHRGPQERWRAPPGNVVPVWAPNESSVVMSVGVGRAAMDAYRVALPYAGLGNLLSDNFAAAGFLRDHRSMLGLMVDSVGAHLASLPVEGGIPARLPLPPGYRAFPSLSPDGSWLAYMSSEQGGWEVYVDPFPALNARRKVSIAGGDEPLWSPRGDRLFYRDRDTWYVVPMDLTTGEIGTPVPFISGPFLNVPGWSYDVSRDGERLLLILDRSKATGNHIRVIRNLLDEIKIAESRTRTRQRN